MPASLTSTVETLKRRLVPSSSTTSVGRRVMAWAPAPPSGRKASKRPQTPSPKGLVLNPVSLSARADNRSQQFRLRGRGDVEDVHAVEISLKQVIALKRQIRIGKSKLRENELERLWHFRCVANAENS